MPAPGKSKSSTAACTSAWTVLSRGRILSEGPALLLAGPQQCGCGSPRLGALFGVTVYVGCQKKIMIAFPLRRDVS